MALTKEQKQELIKSYAQHATDTGSAEVQIAMLTTNIKQLTEHCKMHHKDQSTKRGLLKEVCRRRRLLSYLERTDVQKYKELKDRLGLRK